MIKISEPLDENNWTVWRERMKIILRYCRVDQYVNGNIPYPEDPEKRDIWKQKDGYAQVMISNNITSGQMIHLSQCETAYAMWNSLEAVYEARGTQTIIAIARNLYQTVADDSTNIVEHLNTCKQYWERINLIGDEELRISDAWLKVIISSLLPLSWDAFTDQYVGASRGVKETDPRKLMNSQQFIGILKEEYLRRKV